MHGISFQAKRVHLSAVAYGRRIFQDLPFVRDGRGRAVPVMTPARFDLLYAIYNYDPHAGHVWRLAADQRSIIRILGLHPSTVSKTVTRLVDLGILQDCGKSNCDRRNRKVRITEKGVKLLHRALALVFGKHAKMKCTLEDHVWFTHNKKKKMPGIRRTFKFHAAINGFFTILLSLAGRLGDDSIGLYNPRRGTKRYKQSPEMADFQRAEKAVRWNYGKPKVRLPRRNDPLPNTKVKERTPSEREIDAILDQCFPYV